jgi:hypothetical protein
LEVGITRSEIYQRLRSGALIAVFRGVYRVGHSAPSLEARYLAAVRACGEGAVLSGRAAAQLLGLLKGPVCDPEVTIRGERRVAGKNSRVPVTKPACATTPHPDRSRRCWPGGLTLAAPPSCAACCAAT